MKRNWILRAFMAGCASGLLFGTVALVQAEPKAQRGDVARVARLCLSDTAPVVMARRAEGMGTSFLAGLIRLNSHHHRSEKNQMPTCSKRFMRANRICRPGRLVSLKKKAATYWPMCGPSPSEAMRSASLSARDSRGEKNGWSDTPADPLLPE